MAVAANYDATGAVNGISFPLINPSSDIHGMFEDMSLYSESIGNYKSPFKISSVTGFQFATPSQASLIIQDSDGEEVVNTAGMTFYQEAWGSNRVIYTWKNSTKFLSVVQYVGYGAVLRQNSFSPISAIIDSRVHLANSKKISSVTVGGQTYTGDIKLVAGNNISFLNIDCDTYESTYFILNSIGPTKIVPGTIILFDEYFFLEKSFLSIYLISVSIFHLYIYS